ncbi:MAG: M15 family metallopeptidase [Cyclobacteriaceae bacterium]|jgi:D-alanyl-D-alanine dipeptidase|nr:M15 family metallopeptidase [Cyclobacteriaceae bacterium]
MKKTVLVFFAMMLLEADLAAQYKYGLTPMTMDGYLQHVRQSKNKELVDLEKHVPGVVLDIRYATTNNFTGEKIYNLAKAYARRPVADALLRAQEAFREHGYGIKIFDAYRPYSATVKFYEVYGDTTFVASPYRGSRHNRGCAIDMTLIDLKTGEELAMPTAYDAFVREAFPSHPVADPVIRKNRDLLIRIMENNGFRVNASEWWHFDFRGYRAYEVLDISFEELAGH